MIINSKKGKCFTLREWNFCVPQPLCYPLIKYYKKDFYYNIFCKQLDRYEYVPSEKKKKRQLKRLKKVLLHASRHVPYYRELFKSIGFDPRSVREPDDIKAIPFLTKHIIRAQGERLLDERVSPEQLIRYRTSGTTGTPTYFWSDCVTGFYLDAFMRKQLLLAGWHVSQPYYVFKNPFYIKELQADNTLWTYVRHMIFFNTLQLCERNMPEVVKVINSTKYPGLMGMSTLLYTLAQWCLKNHIEFDHFKGVVGAYENITDHQVAVIEKAFRCQFFNYYGMSEDAVYGLSCGSQKGFHLDTNSSFFEVPDRDKDNRGELVTTSLLRYSMPLIRYKTKDIVEMTGRPCACGRTDPFASHIHGRVTDYLCLPSGRIVNFRCLSDLIFECGTEHIRECQFVQETPRRIRMNIVPETVRGVNTTGIANKVKNFLNEDIELQVCSVNAIPRTRAGKFRFVINKTHDCQPRPVHQA